MIPDPGGILGIFDRGITGFESWSDFGEGIIKNELDSGLVLNDLEPLRSSIVNGTCFPAVDRDGLHCDSVIDHAAGWGTGVSLLVCLAQRTLQFSSCTLGLEGESV